MLAVLSAQRVESKALADDALVGRLDAIVAKTEAA